MIINYKYFSTVIIYLGKLYKSENILYSLIMCSVHNIKDT